MRRLNEWLRRPVESGGHARLRLRLVLLGVLVIGVFGASTAYDAWRSYRHAVLSTESELQNIAGVLAEQTAWSWQGIDSAQTNIARWLRCAQHGVDCLRFETPGGSSPERVDEHLAAVAARLPQVRSLRIIDAQGILQHSSDERGRRGINLSDRSYFRAQRDTTVDGLFVSEPLVSRSEGRTAVLLSRRLVDGEGRFAGIVSANVDLSDLSRLYAAVELRDRVAIQLLRDDGTLLARSPVTPALVGRKFATFTALASDTASRISSPIDGDREFVAVERVRAVPLVIAITANEAAALKTSRQEMIHGALRTLLLAVFGALTIAALLRQLRRLEQSELALRQSQKMEAIGTLAGGIAHDFNNILGAIVGYGELGQHHAPEGSALRRYLDNIMHAAERARALVHRILGFSRSGLVERVPIAVQRVIDETLELLQASLPPNIRLEKQLSAANAAVIGDDTRLHQVTMNLCTNAAHAMPEGGLLRVTLEQLRVAAPRTLSRGQLAPGAHARLTIRDSGTGIPPHILDRIFDPFFTTKPVGEGTGLGLPLVVGIVADLGGAIEVSSVVGVGTTFQVWLPLTSELPKHLAEKARDLPCGNGQTVMIVDDEPALLALTEEMLAELRYEAIGFGSSRAALDSFRATPDRFDVVLTDEMMPELLGTQLARELSTLRPDVPVIIMSGDSGPQLAERAAAAGVSEVLQKPLQKIHLAESLAKLVTGRTGARVA